MKLRHNTLVWNDLSDVVNLWIFKLTYLIKGLRPKLCAVLNLSCLFRVWCVTKTWEQSGSTSTTSPCTWTPSTEAEVRLSPPPGECSTPPCSQLTCGPTLEARPSHSVCLTTGKSFQAIPLLIAPSPTRSLRSARRGRGWNLDPHLWTITWTECNLLPHCYCYC